MEKIPMTKEEIALELVKCVSPGTSTLAFSNIDANAEKIAKAYNKALDIITNPETNKDN